MKKKIITHPKLYFDFKNTSQGLKLFYYSNKLDNYGKRLVEIDLDSQILSFSTNDLNQLNKNEYNKLLTYIIRQERIMKIYLNKGFSDQYQNMKSSLDLMYSFKNDFESIIT
tara:strand:+ start:850 stop:1185 length:336 start_codon:yes stop_codon:yes gene_type:complete